MHWREVSVLFLGTHLLTKSYRVVRVDVGEDGPGALEGCHELVLLKPIGLDYLNAGLSKGLGGVRVRLAGDAVDLEGAGLVAEESASNAASLLASTAENGNDLCGHDG
jgi:hypothetical protein